MHAELGTEPSFFYLYGKASDPDPAAQAPSQCQPVQPQARIRSRGVEPRLQPHWNWKAAGNFLCGGAGTGLFAVAATSSRGEALAITASLALGLVALGLFLLIFKIGRPLRAIYVLRQPRRSWMSREAWVAGVLFPLGLLAVYLQNAAVAAIAALVGLLFLYCQSMILKEAKGIPAWRAAPVVPLIIVTGIAEGAGLFLVLALAVPGLEQKTSAVAGALLALLGLRALVWIGYLAALRKAGAPTRTFEIWQACRLWLIAFAVVLPVIALTLGLLVPATGSLAFAAGGLCAFVSGWALKFILVTRASYSQGFALDHVPVRGRGTAGPAVKPGWILP